MIRRRQAERLQLVPAVTSTPSTATVTTTSAPALTMTKSVTSTGPYNAVGQVITYSFVARNTGNVTLSSVGITDTQTAPAGALTSGPTCSFLSSPTGTCSGSTTTLAPGQSATFTATYTITQADLNNGSVNDSATTSGTPPTGPAVTSSPSTATVTLTQSPAVSLAKSASITSYSAAGTLFTYYFKITNTGNVTLNPVTVTDPHAGLSAIGCPGTSLAPAASETCTATYTTTQADLNAGSITNTATASGTPPSGPAATAKSSVTIPATYLLTTAANPASGGTVTPASGSYFASGATIPVTATANAGFTFSNWTSTGGTFDSSTSASTNFHMPSAPATVTGNFATNDFSIAANPTSLIIQQSASGTSSISTAVTSGSAGTVSLSVTGAPSGASASLSPTSVTAGGSSTLTVNAGTAAVGTYTLTVTGMEGSKTHSATVTLTVTAGVSVTPTNINFGTVRRFSLLFRNVIVKNIGTSTLSISKVSVTPGTGADSDDFTPISFCGSSLAPGKSCTIVVAFFADNLGALSATLDITDSAAGSPQTVALTGNVKKDD